ncbi:putative ydaA [Escherichia coli 7-233-03_S3_C3]|nr:putative ydaA [Escherichia coli 7-233-03_S3_C3]
MRSAQDRCVRSWLEKQAHSGRAASVAPWPALLASRQKAAGM